MTWLKTAISKKLFTTIATFVINIAIVTGNKALGSPLDAASIITLVASIVTVATGFLFAQGAVDKAKIQNNTSKVELGVAVMRQVNDPTTPTKMTDAEVSNIMDRI